jgi:hypothetical protein
MKQTFVADKEVILVLEGLRWVAKKNFSGGTHYMLEWAYKGQEKSHDYEGKEEDRDAMFDKVSEALQKPEDANKLAQTLIEAFNKGLQQGMKREKKKSPAKDPGEVPGARYTEEP